MSKATGGGRSKPPKTTANFERQRTPNIEAAKNLLKEMSWRRDERTFGDRQVLRYDLTGNPSIVTLPSDESETPHSPDLVNLGAGVTPDAFRDYILPYDPIKDPSGVAQYEAEMAAARKAEAENAPVRKKAEQNHLLLLALEHLKETTEKLSNIANYSSIVDDIHTGIAVCRDIINELNEEKNYAVIDQFSNSEKFDKKDEGAMKGPHVTAPDLYDSLREAERHAGKECPALVPDIQKLLAKISGAEVTGREAAPVAQTTAKPFAAPATQNTPELSEAALAEFRTHANAHPWKSRSGVAPSAHIETTFAKWLGRGLMREHIVEVQRNLAGAYATEISRDPSKRVEGLGVRPPISKLPVGAPRPPSLRPVAELSEEERDVRREKKAAAQRRWWAKRQIDPPM